MSILLIMANNKKRHFITCSLEFEEENFDGIWSGQTTQHIPNFDIVCSEAFRVLKIKGIYSDYGLNDAALIRIFYKLFGKIERSKCII